MTTLEEVFLHLERDEETECTMDNLSKKLVRNRALSRSLSLQSKSTSYQSLQNEGNANSIEKDGKAGGEMQTGGLEIISETKYPISGLGFEKIETKPNAFQTLLALLRLRILRMIRDLQKLYIMILLPLALAAGGLYLNSMQVLEPRFKVLALNKDTYGVKTTLAVHNRTDSNLDPFLNNLVDMGVQDITVYNGNFSFLLEIAPHMGAMNFNAFDMPEVSITAIYNDTMQHSLPIIMNLISNAFFR